MWTNGRNTNFVTDYVNVVFSGCALKEMPNGIGNDSLGEMDEVLSPLEIYSLQRQLGHYIKLIAFLYGLK